jgi:hypothetical protein
LYAPLGATRSRSAHHAGPNAVNLGAAIPAKSIMSANEMTAIIAADFDAGGLIATATPPSSPIASTRLHATE